MSSEGDGVRGSDSDAMPDSVAEGEFENDDVGVSVAGGVSVRVGDVLGEADVDALGDARLRDRETVGAVTDTLCETVTGADAVRVTRQSEALTETAKYATAGPSSGIRSEAARTPLRNAPSNVVVATSEPPSRSDTLYATARTGATLPSPTRPACNAAVAMSVVCV